MVPNDLKRICQQARTVISQVAAFQRSEMGKVTPEAVESKSLNSLVSYVDKTSEEQLVTGLQHILPEGRFLTEEGTVVAQTGTWQWIVDPLDGTTNYLHGLPCYSISVALQYQQRTVLGIVHEVSRDECFYAWSGSGLLVNDTPAQVSLTAKMSDSLIATGFPYYDFDRQDDYLHILAQLMTQTRGIRRFGSAAVDLAWVACGRFDAFFEYSLHPWDVAAGAFLVQEAGGRVGDFRGGDRYIHGREILATNPSLWTAILDLINPSLSRLDP